MDDTTILGNALGQLGQAVKQTAKQVVKIPQEMAQDAGKQIASNADDNKSANGQKPEEQKAGFQNDEDRIAFLKSLYGPTEEEKQNPPSPASGVASARQGDEEFEKQIADKTPEEQQQLRALRKQLHDQYYQQLIHPAKPQEERPAEKVENEKKQEMAELQQKEEKKPQPLAVQREQNKAEQFRGAAG